MFLNDSDRVKIELVESVGSLFINEELLQPNKNECKQELEQVLCQSTGGSTTTTSTTLLDDTGEVLKSEVVKEEEMFGNDIINTTETGNRTNKDVVMTLEQKTMVSV